MKKVTKPSEKEEAVFYSDFTGKMLNECGPDVDLKISFNYGSKRDGASLTLHLSDDDVRPIIELIKQKLSVDIKEQLVEQLEKQEDDFDDSMQFRDWNSCDYLSNSIWFLRELLDIKEE